ncbi:MAG: 2Fe-2S ferredoxin [Pseudomonadota bacterium]
MPRITFITPQGDHHLVDATIGMSVMEAAVQNNVPGIVAECGGACACATCHAYAAEDQFASLVTPDDMEQEMLEFAADPIPGRSRLTCQVKVGAESEGLTFTVPTQQA